MAGPAAANLQAVPDHADVLVVGAGLAGATAASCLAAAGCRVLILDKGRGPGGRLSTRRTDAGGFDHGAASVQAAGEAFRSWLDAGMTSGRVSAWAEGQWVGIPGMNALVSDLLEGLGPRWSTTVATLRRRADGAWDALDDAGTSIGSATWLVLAIPAPQARSLLRRSLADADVAAIDAALAEVRYAPCWAALLSLSAECGPTTPCLSPNDGVLERAVRESSKPGRAKGCWTLHATADWSERELEQSAEHVASRLVEAFLQASGVDASAVLSASAHRWRYASAVQGTASAGAPTIRLCLAGDAVGWSPEESDIPPAERAWRSGKAAAATVLAGLQPKS